MPVEVGQVLEGKVTGITKFGAFVALPERESGLVHISEISDSYVESVQDFLQKDDVVTVKVMSIKDGKIGLSIRKAGPQKEQQPRPPRSREPRPKPAVQEKDLTFEDRLSRFMKESNERHDQIRHRENKRGSSGRSRGKNVNV